MVCFDDDDGHISVAFVITVIIIVYLLKEKETIFSWYYYFPSLFLWESTIYVSYIDCPYNIICGVVVKRQRVVLCMALHILLLTRGTDHYNAHPSRLGPQHIARIVSFLRLSPSHDVVSFAVVVCLT